MHVSLQIAKTAEIHEGLIRSSDDLPILYYIHSTGGRGDRIAARAPVIKRVIAVYLFLCYYVRDRTTQPSRTSVLVIQLCQIKR
jgi:hypothetical protein